METEQDQTEKGALLTHHVCQPDKWNGSAEAFVDFNQKIAFYLQKIKFGPLLKVPKTLR